MKIISSSLIFGGLTLLSRALGFMRDLVLSARLGAGPVADAFYVAMRFPNLFRRLFAEGAFNAAFVPVYARVLEADGEKSADEIASEALMVLASITAGLTILAQLTMPWIVMGLAPGFIEDPDIFTLAVFLTQITMPYLSFMAIAALFSGALNAKNRFVLSAFAPTLLNICLLIAGSSQTEPQNVAKACAVAISISGFLQILLLYWGVRQANIHIRFAWPRITGHVKHLLNLAIPGAISAGAVQINIAVSQILASFQSGAISWLQYADRLYQLPLGVVGVAVGIVMLPSLSRAAKAGNKEQSQARMDEGIAFAMALTLPCALALMILPEFLISGLFVRGAFTPYDAGQTALALYHYGWGVIAFVLIKILTPGFFAREDTKTPMRIALINVAINIGAGILLFYLLGFYGLAIATSLGAWCNTILLGVLLYKRGYYRPQIQALTRLFRILLANLAFAGLLIACAMHQNMVINLVGGEDSLAVPLVVFFGVFVYGLLLISFQGLTLVEIRRAFQKQA